MSIAGIESEMKWVRKSLRALRDEVIELDNRDIIEAFEDLESYLMNVKKLFQMFKVYRRINK